MSMNDRIDENGQYHEPITSRYLIDTWRTLAPKKYTVYVGGGEVNDSLLTKGQAQELAQKYRSRGYKDVAVLEVVTS